MSTSAPLSNDALWPRAGNWPRSHAGSGARDVDVALIGVPAWRTSLSPTGAHATPAAIREALRRYSPALMPSGANPEGLDLGALRVIDLGHIEGPDGPEGEARTRAAVAEASTHSQLVVALGGDNSVTVATAEGSLGDLGSAGLITLDAHYDLRDGVSNGSPVRRLIEAGVDGRRVVQLGIADFANSAAYARRAIELGITVVHVDELRRRGVVAAMLEAVEIAGAGGGRIHLDIDVDVCDRSVAPGCPASMPGGLAAWELRAAVRAAASDARVVSADIAEVDATADAPDGRTVRLAALLVLELLAGVALRAVK